MCKIPFQEGPAIGPREIYLARMRKLVQINKTEINTEPFATCHYAY